MELSLLLQVAVALGLGLLIGLQRQRTEAEIAGIRTFPLIALLGFLSGLAAGEFGGWVVGAAFLAVALVVLVGDVARWRTGHVDPGITTEVAALVTFAVGVILALDYMVIAVFVGGASVVLLQWKRPLHRLADRIGQEDFRALTRLVLIALVILPVLPNRAYGPYEVLNPFQIWLMVALIVGISMSGYVAYKLLGPRGGPAVAGALGGLISSTAATVGFARRSAERPRSADGLALAITIASTVTFARVLFEIAVVTPSSLSGMGPPLAVMMFGMVGISATLYLLTRNRLGDISKEGEAPSNMSAALFFGLLYAVVLVGVAAAKDHFGQSGMLVVAGLSGLTDMDAITLSTAQLVRTGDVTIDAGWRLILVGGLGNLAFKGLAVMILACGRARLLVGATFGLALAFGAILLWLWP